jgi:hypothetical protein
MIFIIILIGFLILNNMSFRSYSSRRHPFYNDYPYRQDFDNPYFHRPMPYFSPNTEGGYQQFHRENTRQSLRFTLLFLLALIAFLFYLHS